MKTDICTKFDAYMRTYCATNVNMSWTMELQNGLTVYGDYDRPGYEKCWTRVKSYCERENVLPVKVKLFMLGVPEFTFFENPNGLDGISVCRGAAMEHSLSGQMSKSFQFLSVSYLDNEHDYINVRKFVWPFNQFEEGESVRQITKDNVLQMIFKNESEKAKRKEIQQHLDGATV